MTEKIKLTGGLEKTVTWIWLEEGCLKIEYYDFTSHFEVTRWLDENQIEYTKDIESWA